MTMRRRQAWSAWQVGAWAGWLVLFVLMWSPGIALADDKQDATSSSSRPS